MRVRPTYTDEFKADAVALLARTDRSIPQLAQDIGISERSLRDWYKASVMGKKPKKKVAGVRVVVAKAEQELSADERVKSLERENAALRKENESLKTDRAILKKAAAFFAKESE
jgi:transposase